MIDLLSRKLNKELFCCYTRTWIVYQHFVLWFKYNKKTGNGNNKSMGCRTNCKCSRTKRSSYVSRLRPWHRTCSFWEIIWCAMPVAMNGRHSTTEEHSNSHPHTERLINLSTPNTTSAFYNAKSWTLSKNGFTRNAYKKSWQCAMEDRARQRVMEI